MGVQHMGSVVECEAESKLFCRSGKGPHKNTCVAFSTADGLELEDHVLASPKSIPTTKSMPAALIFLKVTVLQENAGV